MSMGHNGPRLLLVDDDEELCELVCKYLQARGFAIDTEGDGARGLQRAQSGGHDLLVLDVMLPSMDGLEVLRRLRADGGASRLPVVMLTAHGDETDRIVGLELGADDYLPKPFNPRELLARVNAVLRRAESARPNLSNAPSAPDEKLTAAGIEMDVAARTVRRAGEDIELTAVEFDLLHVLMSDAGRVVTRDDAARRGLKRRLLPLDRSLDMHISNLRAKVWPQGEGMERLKTVRGVGYLLGKDA